MATLLRYLLIVADLSRLKTNNDLGRTRAPWSFYGNQMALIQKPPH